jgi:hypothetical protein
MMLPSYREVSPEQAAQLGMPIGVIRNLAGYSVALDTSALSNVLNGGARAIRPFADATKRHGATVAISNTVLFELTADANIKGVARRLKGLQRLQRELGPLLCLSLQSTDLLNAEARSRLTAAPGYADVDWTWLANAHRRDLLEVAADMRESYDFIRQRKNKLFELDRKLHQELLAKGIQYDPAQLFALITGRDPPPADEMIIEWTAKFSEGRYTPQQVAADQMRFKAAHVISHLVWRLQLANCADRTTTPEQEQVFGLWRTKGKARGEGVWYDAFIAGEAAYMDLLVSDDDNQRRRCDFLRKRGLLSFESKSLDDFLR